MTVETDPAERGAALVIMYIRAVVEGRHAPDPEALPEFAGGSLPSPLGDVVNRALVNAICDVLHAGDGHYGPPSIIGHAFTLYASGDDGAQAHEVTAESPWSSLAALGGTVAALLASAGRFFDVADDLARKAMEQFANEIEEARFEAISHQRAYWVPRAARRVRISGDQPTP
ncbi:hypothetical protein ACFV9E_37205 [Streptomyces sp. NPDC059835]|uniref:hypothetical protein n=1 Tax=Streptomyces sp. NPDC059835 TaxID=3346967 RepID=UPI00365EA71E